MKGGESGTATNLKRKKLDTKSPNGLSSIRLKSSTGAQRQSNIKGPQEAARSTIGNTQLKSVKGDHPSANALKGQTSVANIMRKTLD